MAKMQEMIERMTINMKPANETPLDPKSAESAIKAEPDNFRPAAPGNWILTDWKSRNLRLHFTWFRESDGMRCVITFAPADIKLAPVYATLLPGGWMEVYTHPKDGEMHPLKVTNL